MNPQKLAELLAKAKAKVAERNTTTLTTSITSAEESSDSNSSNSSNTNFLPSNTNSSLVTGLTNQYGEIIELNQAQQQAVELATSGKSFCLIGAAGTGKTTSMKAVIYALEQKGMPAYSCDGHKHLATSGTPGIVGCAFTRSAVANLKKNMPSNMQSNCVTLHALLEYKPVFYEEINEKGDFIKKRVFEPSRNSNNPLDPSIKVIIIEEASMPSVELFLQVLDALQHPVQFIFLGDLNQLPPVMGTAILGYAVVSLPTVELTEVYRNAGPIITFAHRILSGKPLHSTKFQDYEVPEVIKIQPWKKKLFSEDAVMVASRAVINLIDAGLIDPYEDMILCPYNKAFGTIEINKYIANHLSRKAGAVTYEIITGFSTQYFAVGDRVLSDKELGTIVSISPNITYLGKQPQPASKYLDRWGIVNKEGESELVQHSTDPRDIDTILESFTVMTDSDDIKRQASHTIKIALDKHSELDNSDDYLVELGSAGEVNALLLGYAITVHKSQGSEWRRVILLLHHSHNTMLARELLYTAVTRARQSLHIICEADTFVKGIEKQRITGNTLTEKAEYFKGKALVTDLSKLRFN